MRMKNSTSGLNVNIDKWIENIYHNNLVQGKWSIKSSCFVQNWHIFSNQYGINDVLSRLVVISVCNIRAVCVCAAAVIAATRVGGRHGNSGGGAPAALLCQAFA